MGDNQIEILTHTVEQSRAAIGIECNNMVTIAAAAEGLWKAVATSTDPVIEDYVSNRLDSNHLSNFTILTPIHIPRIVMFKLHGQP